MNFDFELILFWAMVVTGVIALADVLYFARKRKSKALTSAPFTNPKQPLLIEYARAFFPILVLVFGLRSFLYEPFRIPSGSLEPTLLMGDFILTNKFDYGLRLPVLRTKIVKLGEPKHGDIVVFRWPPDTSYYFIKRVIGLPGDRVDYIDKVLKVNGQVMVQKDLSQPQELKTVKRNSDQTIQVIEKEEDLFGIKHHIYIEPNKTGYNFENINVPAGMYLVMGDNRDDSADSRYWGFVPEENIVGKAVFIWMSWDSFAPWGWNKIRWDRIGKVVH